MNKRVLEIAGSLVGIVLFAVALWVLHREFSHLHYHDVMAQLHALPYYRVGLAFLFTMCSYLALSGYDWLSLRYIRHALEYPKVLLTSFITYAIGHNLGFSLFTGGSIRLRLYSAWGLSTFEITSLMGFGIITFWLGYLSAGAVTFLTMPPNIPAQVHIPFGSALPLGILFVAIVLTYVSWITLIRKPIKVRGWQFEVPAPSLTVSQVAVGMFDWLVASAALYVLLPSVEGLSYGHVVGVYLLSQIAGLASNVPGGLGVFETVFILLLGPVAEPAQLVSSLLAYRLIYYLLPLALASVSLAGYELARRGARIKRIAAGVGKFVPMFVPQVLSFTVFVSGVVLLFSGATPAVQSRLLFLERFLPLSVIEISHFVGSILGLGLLILARGLQRRVDA
ncbi:MAG TPA: lysylphosphatidylglycerol synthase domain-containing protein, partial [Candidatus Acidoferrum sp.]|nr:lysylphosphatidylglycerol synthase domain-containing protein [Candidatus Acidoferrum sp.]